MHILSLERERELEMKLVRNLPVILLLSKQFLSNALSDTGNIPKAHLLKQAAAFRSSLNEASTERKLPSQKDLFYNSAYQQTENISNILHGESDVRLRGFCNWLIPNKVMIGQYPAQTPEANGASLTQSRRHIHSLLHSARIRTFCSLQSEIPAQDNMEKWRKAGGEVFLEGTAGKDFPHYFSHYEPLVQEALQEQSSKDSSGSSSVTFLHAPILDLNTPSSESLYTLLSTLLDQLDSSNEQDRNEDAIYIHCWGGRGRAGLVGACLLALVFPELEAKDCLEWVQQGYDTRLGASSMPLQLQRSPQTYSQEKFVYDFAAEIRSLR
jgi:alanine transaminase